MAQTELKLSPADFYGHVACEYDQPHHGRFYRRVAAELAGRIPADAPVGSILEVGSGTGFATEVFRRRYPDADITALEPSPEMLWRARDKVSGVNWRCGPLSGFSGGGFDLVLASMSYHWLDAAEREKLMGLAENGMLALALPVTGGHGACDGNLALRKLSFRLGGRRNWPRETRRIAGITPLLRSCFSDARIYSLNIREEHENKQELAQSLYARGALYALFEEDAGPARNLLAAGDGGRVGFNWTIGLIVAGNPVSGGGAGF